MEDTDVGQDSSTASLSSSFRADVRPDAFTMPRLPPARAALPPSRSPPPESEDDARSIASLPAAKGKAKAKAKSAGYGSSVVEETPKEGKSYWIKLAAPRNCNSA